MPLSLGGLRSAVAAVAGAALGLFLSGCSLSPAYRRPALAVRPSYPAGPSYTDPAGDAAREAVVPLAADVGWRDFFAEPVLQDLIALALKNNRDLRVAVENVTQAQAAYHLERANLAPAVSGVGSAEYERIPGGTAGVPGSARIHDFSLGLSSASYELDFFGKIRSATMAKKEQFLSSEETRRSTQISLEAQVGAEYLALLADREALAISSQTVATSSRSLQLYTMTVDEGTGTALEMSQQETTLRTAEASVAQYVRQVAQDTDEIVVQVGAPLPAALETRLRERGGLPGEGFFPPLREGIPSELLERRPDILAAEHDLEAANIGAARAAFFPSVTLTGSAGTASPGLNKLFAAGTSSWSFQPQVNLPIFDGGANLANLATANSAKRSAVASYEKAVESAFHDVADALAGRATYVSQVKADQRLVDASQRYYDLAKMRFDAGVEDFLDVLVAKNSLFSAQLTLIGVRLAQQQNLITLYKSLGGGWTDRTAVPRRLTGGEPPPLRLVAR